MKNKRKTAFVIKASGEKHKFSEDKLRASLLRSGADKPVVDAIINQVISKLYDGISTSEIYGIAFRKLKQYKKGPAAKFKLKNAIMELGPTGFPFEQFIARIFQCLGYKIQTGVLISGKCVKHEVDVVAKKSQEHNLIECKFHQKKGIFCDVKIPLYVSARFLDIESAGGSEKEINQAPTPFKGWLITNTHFTKDAIAYGLCAGLNLIGWNFPEKGSLRELIDQYGLHPITSLTTLTRQEKLKLLERNIVLCSELITEEKVLETIIPAKRINNVHKECNQLAGQKNNLT